MVYLSEQRIREYLMIIAKFCGIILIGLNISCKNMDNEYFQVFGKKEVLDKCKINLVKIDEAGKDSLYNILCNGKLNRVKAENESAAIYKFYISYNNSSVEVLKTENIFRNATDQVNYLYLEEKDHLIYVKFVGRKANIENSEFNKVLIDRAQYDHNSGSTDGSDDAKELNSLFFECK